MRNFEQNATDAYGQLNMDAIIGGGAEAQRMQGMDIGRRAQLGDERTQMGSFYNDAADQALRQQLGIGNQEFNQGLQQSGFQNTLRQQQIAEAMQQRGFTLNEINAIMTGQQVGMPSMPGFQAAGRANAVDYLGAANMQDQANLERFSIDQANAQAGLSGATDLLGAGAMMFSDRRLKREIQKIGTHVSGLAVYVFKYLWDDVIHVGFIADEVKQSFPNAVIRHSSGYDMVNYGVIK